MATEDTESILQDDLIPETTNEDEPINTSNVSLSLSVSSKLSLHTNDIELSKMGNTATATASTTSTNSTSSSFPSYEYEAAEGSVSSLTSDSWPQQYPIDPFMVQNNETLSDVMFDAFANMVNAFGGFDYSNIADANNASNGEIDVDGNVMIVGAHQKKTNRKCITICVLLVIVTSVIGLIVYSTNMDLPQPPSFDIAPAVFDAAPMLPDEYKPMNQNTSVQYAFNLTFDAQTKPLHLLNFGSGLASDIASILDIDIRRLVIHSCEPSARDPLLFYTVIGIRMMDTKTQQSSIRRRLITTMNATEEIKSLHFALINLFKTKSSELTQNDYTKYIKLDDLIPIILLSGHALIGLQSTDHQNCLRFLHLEGSEKACIIDGCLVDDTTLNLFSQSLPNHESSLVIHNCSVAFNPEMDAQVRDKIIAEKYSKKTFDENDKLFDVDLSEWDSMVTGAIVLVHYVWHVEAWLTKPPDAKLFIYSQKTPSRDAAYEPYTITLEQSMKDELIDKAKAYGLEENIANSAANTITLKIEGRSNGISPCDVLKHLPTNFAENPLFCISYFRGEHIVFSNYESEYATAYEGLTFWDVTHFFEMYRDGKEIESIAQVTVWQMLNIDIRIGFYISGNMDPFGPLRWIILKLFPSMTSKQIIRKYMNPLPCKGQIRPNVNLELIYDQLYMTLFGKIQIYDWRLRYNEVEDSHNFMVQLSLDLFTSQKAKKCEENWFELTMGTGPNGQGYKQTARFIGSGMLFARGMMIKLDQINHTNYDPPGPNGLHTHKPITCQLSMLDGIIQTSCDAVFRYGANTESVTFLQSKFNIGGYKIGIQNTKSNEMKEDDTKPKKDLSNIASAKTDKLRAKYAKMFTRPTFDIYMAVSYGVGVDVEESLMDKKAESANIKRKKLIQWAQLCQTGKIAEIATDECDEASYIFLQQKYRNQSIALSYPQLYDIEAVHLDAASPFLQNAETEQKCINIADKYEKRRKLLEEYGWNTWITPVYANDAARGWTQDMAFAQPNVYSLNGEVDCQLTCKEINGALIGVRFIGKGQTTGPATQCESELRMQFVDGGNALCPTDQETILRDCFSGSCVDRMDGFALECHCEGWRKWVIADYQPRLQNHTEARYLNKWNRMYGYDYNIIFNGEVRCDRACTRMDDGAAVSGIRWICNAAAMTGSIFFNDTIEGCNTLIDGKMAQSYCTERIQENVYFGEQSASFGSCVQFMTEEMNGEDYLTECMKNKCVETADYHALQCQCEGAIKDVQIPYNCDDSTDPREGPTANLNAFGFPSSNGAVVGHMAFALISPRENDPNYTANWTIIGTGITLDVKPGFNLWINVLPGMSPGLGMIRDMFLYEGKLQLSGWLSFDQKFQLNGVIRELALDEGKKYIPYLDITVSNVAPYFIGEGEVYVNRDFLGLPNMRDILYFIFDFAIPDEEEDTGLSEEEQYEKDYLERIYNARQSMENGVNFILEYAEFGKSYAYMSLVMAEHAKLDLSFGFTALALQRVDLVMAISMGEAIKSADKRPKICSGFSARILADVAILGNWMWVDYAQNACKKGKANPIIIKSGHRPLNYGRDNKTRYVAGKADACMELDRQQINQTKTEDDSLGGLSNLSGMKVQEKSEDVDQTAASNTSNTESTANEYDVLGIGIYTTGLVIYPTTLSIKGKGSLRLTFMEGCYFWQININPMTGIYSILRPVLNDGESILVKFKGKMSWLQLPIIRPTLVLSSSPKTLQVPIPRFRGLPQSNMTFYAQTGLTMATRMIVGSSSTQTLDLAFLKYKGKPYVDFTVSFGPDGLVLSGKIHGNFFLNLGIVQAVFTDLVVGMVKQPGQETAARVEGRFGVHFGWMAVEPGTDEKPPSMAYFRAMVQKSSEEVSIQGQICGIVNQSIDHVLSYGLGTVVKRRKDINLTDPQYQGFDMPPGNDPEEMIVVTKGKCDPNPEMAWDVNLLNGVQLTWLAVEYTQMGYDKQYGFQTGFWLPQTAHWLIGIEMAPATKEYSIVAAVDARPRDQIIATLKLMLQSISVTEGQWGGIQKIDSYSSDARSVMQSIGCRDTVGVIKVDYLGAGCAVANATGTIDSMTTEDLTLTFHCDRVSLECLNMTQDAFVSLCDIDAVVQKSCNYTCDRCNYDATVHAFTVAELIDAVLNAMPLSYAAPLGVGNILRFTPMAVVNFIIEQAVGPFKDDEVEYVWTGRLGTLFDRVFPRILQISFQYESMPTFMKVSAVALIDDTPNGFLLEFGMDPVDGGQKATLAFIDEQGNEKNVLDFLMSFLKKLFKKAQFGAIGLPQWYYVNSWLNETQIKCYLAPSGMFLVTPVDPTAYPWKIIMTLFRIDHAALGLVFHGLEEWKLFLAFERPFDIGFLDGIIREFFLWKFPEIKLPLIGITADINILLPGDSQKVPFVMLIGLGTSEAGAIVWFAGNLQVGFIWQNPFGLPLIIYKAGWSIKMLITSAPMPVVFELSGLCEMQIGGTLNEKDTGIWGDFKYHQEMPVSAAASPDPADQIPVTGFAFNITHFTLHKLLETFVPDITEYLPSWLDVGFELLAFSYCPECLFPLMFEAGPGNIVTIEPGILLHAKEFWMFDKETVYGKEIYFSYGLFGIETFGDLWINVAFGSGKFSRIRIYLHGMGNDDIPATWEFRLTILTGVKMHFDGQAEISFFGVTVSMAMAIEVNLDVFFGLFMLRFEILSLEFEFLILFQIEGGLASPQSVTVGALFTMSPGEYFPSFAMITTTMGEEGKFKKLFAKCKKDDSRDLILHGGVLTTQDVEIGLKVIPSMDWKYPLNDLDHTVLDYDYYLNNKTQELLCYGKIVGENSHCKTKKGRYRVKWNSACATHIHPLMRGIRCHAVGYKGLMELGMRPQLIGYKLSCNREFGARYSMLDFCLDSLYAQGVKDNPNMVKTCYTIAGKVKVIDIPRKSAGQVCSPYADCDDWQYCPRMLKVMFGIRSLKGCDDDGRRRMIGSGEGDGEDEAVVNELYERYHELKDKMNNPQRLGEGDVWEGRFILQSLQHIMNKKGLKPSRRELQQMNQIMSDAADKEKETYTIPQKKAEGEQSDQHNKRSNHQSNRRREKSQKQGELKRRSRRRRRMRRRRRRMLNDELSSLRWTQHDHNELHEEMTLRIDDIEHGINHFEDQISKLEDRLSEWTESESEFSWNMKMDMISHHEDRVWALKELRDDMFHHLWLLEERMHDIALKINKLQWAETAADTVYVGFNRFKMNQTVDDDDYTNASASASDVVVFTKKGNEGEYSAERRRLWSPWSWLKKLINRLKNAIRQLGSFISKLGDLLKALGELIVKLVEFIISLLSALFKVLLIAFKADVRGIVSTQVTVDFAVSLSVFFVPVRFCIHLSFGDLDDGLKDAADKATDSHTSAEQESKWNEEAKKSDSKGNTNQVTSRTPAPLQRPDADPPLQPRSGLPNLGLTLDSNWCDMV
eukprot:1140735_1